MFKNFNQRGPRSVSEILSDAVGLREELRDAANEANAEMERTQEQIDGLMQTQETLSQERDNAERIIGRINDFLD